MNLKYTFFKKGVSLKKLPKLWRTDPPVHVGAPQLGSFRSETPFLKNVYFNNSRFIAGCCLHLPMPSTSNSVTLEETLIKIKIAEQCSRIVKKTSQP